jgi:hypothetical protein
MTSEVRDGRQVVFVPIGDVTLQVSAYQYVETTVAIAATAASASAQLDPGSTVTGTARGTDGEPLPSRYYVVVEGCPTQVTSFVGRAGTFELKGVAPGNCTAFVQFANGGPKGPAKAIVVPVRGAVSVELVGPAAK